VCLRHGRGGQIESNAIFGYISAHRSFGQILVATAGFYARRLS
jgi:hypothetical protein